MSFRRRSAPCPTVRPPSKKKDAGDAYIAASAAGAAAAERPGTTRSVVSRTTSTTWTSPTQTVATTYAIQPPNMP